MYLLNKDRFSLIECLPPGLTTAEIGVARGDFSDGMLRLTQPKKLHLIDPWRRIEKADYLGDENNTDDAEGEARFNYVAGRFADPIANGQVVVHRALSQEVVDQFPDEYFDWIYVDADHTYRGCLTDLELFDRKIKRDGMIFGHDYTNEEIALKFDFGVVDAVNEFVGLRDYRLLALTMESFPTIAIAKQPDSVLAQHFIRRLRALAPVMIEIRDAEIRNFRLRFMANDAAQQTILSFG